MSFLMRKRGDTSYVASKIYLHQNDQKIERSDGWLYCYLLKQQLLKKGERLGVTLAQMLLIAIYSALGRELPESTPFEKSLKFSLLCSLVLACHRRRVPFALIDFSYLDKLKREIVSNRIQTVTNRKSGIVSEVQNSQNTQTIYDINDQNSEDFEFHSAVVSYSLVESLKKYSV